ncbi:MAG: SH3 domain-containing protein [Eubacteriales bacterium]|nr:SH3 domain-containing protein [Eubacteriales bacterium]
MNNIKRNIEKEYKDLLDLILLEEYDEAVKLMYAIVRNLVIFQIDDACLISKDFDNDLEILLGAKIIEKGTYDNYKGICTLYEMIMSGTKAPIDTIKLGADILKNEIDYAIRREIMPLQDDIKTGSYGGNIDFPLYDGKRLSDEDDLVRTVDRREEARIRMEQARNEMRNEENSNYNPNSNEDIFYQNKIKNNKQNVKGPKAQFKITPINILKIVIPLSCIIIIFFIVRSILPQKVVETTPPTLDPMQESFLNSLETSSEEIETTMSEAGIYIVTGNTVKLRNEPNTTSNVYTFVNQNTEVEVINFYDDDWALIKYDGRNLYISRSFIERQ